MLILRKNGTVLILTGKEEDDSLQKLVEDKMNHFGVEIKLKVDPLREKPVLLTPKGMFKGESGIRFYLNRFIACS